MKAVKYALTMAIAMTMGAAHAADAPQAPGAAVYAEMCGMCHQTNGMGVGILSRRADASKGLLEQRADLSAAVVKVVVRNGIGNMPRISRGEVSDAQLDAIASYLSRGKP
mgnify:CR=1 FL=1